MGLLSNSLPLFIIILKRKTECTARVAGEEFYIILKDAPPAIALYHAEKLRHVIAHHSFKINDRQTTPLTVSIGISSSPDNAVDFDELAIIATQVTTEVKALGGNQVVHANNSEFHKGC